jgi:hypothetical protein
MNWSLDQLESIDRDRYEVLVEELLKEDERSRD